ncbi:phage tail protein [Mucilaginibacter agri]|uniref:Phage tail protein n=1 Tax=Mucilaginibacter agri TaxID=2695265 RepID=A0A966DUB7_9SPHI|nr:tail fiber protein [Mucilaginibacter agri]NCD70237.1 phage tail protein [Mucilaginibacter agri]
MDWYLGEIKIISQNFAPKGWALCNGQLLPIAQNQALFALLGTIYGGNGIQTFGLPNLQGRIPLGFSTQYPQGLISGTNSATLTANQLPMHNHMFLANNAAGNTAAPSGAYFAISGTADNDYSTGQPNAVMAPNELGMAGSSQPVSTQQPYLALNFVIATTGIYPSRN